MKDAFRDVYTALLTALNKEAIASGKTNLHKVSFDTSDESIALVEDYLNSFKESICGWEADFGKEQMTKELAWINLSWSGDAQWAIEEAAELNVDLGYTIPKEGSAVWFDGWVIPKYARNVKAASYFINYMCMPENAILNMEEIGYVSVIASPEILEWANDDEIEETSDLSYFFGDMEGADSLHVNHVLYPDKSIIERCALMHDCGEKTEDMLAMWSRIKGDNLKPWHVWFVAIVVGGVIVCLIIQAINKKRKRDMQQKKRKRKKD